MYDVIIIGAGVVGCAVARELSRYEVKACVIDKCEDVCSGTTKANSAIVHAGYDAAEGSLMAKLNVKGNQLMGELSKELDFPFKRNGSLVVCVNKEEMPRLEALYERGAANGVKGLQILSKEEVKKMEPNITDEVEGALYAPSAGIVCPFNLTIALAENANANGVEFKFNTEVIDITKKNDIYQLQTNGEMIETKYVVNAAGVHAGEIHSFVSRKKYKITPRRGDYFLLDKSVGDYVSKTIFTLPTKFGKGVVVAPTVHGNLIVGPTAIDIEDKEGTNTTKEGLEELIKKVGISVKGVPIKQVITSFSGLRAHEEGHEFIIEELEDSKGFINVLGIESPGLTSAPAIGIMVADLLRDLNHLSKKENFISKRKGILDPSTLTMEERNELIQKNNTYGNIICRCEMISEGEIIDAIRRPLGARSLDGIKRRVRAGSGRCQAGFCTPRTLEIMVRELGIPMEEITKSGGKSYIVMGHSKETI
ncbi:glycerol-3-phosphate dehydrogenase [Anaerocolumna jejuensis DSM 15929]|uniref:Glycerol-3-phosphate dehydrogenase n=1 Tax=Anaerocolumna jejuensis DSM 15929 TaxID=1121322 RepID=A0A1M6SWU8_9FIRM|nr:NAD(P)/FAD-dependent oxidoreductase [Anaerocolumna jejuensis]SHK49156.1 glycerol-3-phosphate dehydrogenase [Anaerocolumna jejuensis DSM 15929]